LAYAGWDNINCNQYIMYNSIIEHVVQSMVNIRENGKEGGKDILWSLFCLV